jgi:hypothetical protein
MLSSLKMVCFHHYWHIFCYFFRRLRRWWKFLKGTWGKQWCFCKVPAAFAAKTILSLPPSSWTSLGYVVFVHALTLASETNWISGAYVTIASSPLQGVILALCFCPRKIGVGCSQNVPYWSSLWKLSITVHTHKSSLAIGIFFCCLAATPRCPFSSTLCSKCLYRSVSF